MGESRIVKGKYTMQLIRWLLTGFAGGYSHKNPMISKSLENYSDKYRMTESDLRQIILYELNQTSVSCGISQKREVHNYSTDGNEYELISVASCKLGLVINQSKSQIVRAFRTDGATSPSPIGRISRYQPYADKRQASYYHGERYKKRIRVGYETIVNNPIYKGWTCKQVNENTFKMIYKVMTESCLDFIAPSKLFRTENNNMDID